MTGDAAAAFVDYARRYAELGYALIRVDGKRPQEKDWQRTRPDCDPEHVAGLWSVWGERWNMGVVLGSSGLAVVEADTEEAAKTLIGLLDGIVIRTPMVQSGRGLPHVYFRDPGGLEKSVCGGLELRAGSHMMVLPPSKHPAAGEEYRWLVPPWEADLAELPAELIDFFDAAKAKKNAEPLADDEPIPEGKRDVTLTSIAGTMRRRGLTGEEILAALREVNRRRCRPPLPDNRVEEIAASVGRYEPAEGLTDLTVDDILAASPDLSKDELLADNPRLKALIGGRSSAASEVVRLVRESGVLLFHDSGRRAYASFCAEDGGSQQTWSLSSRAFKLYARRLYYRAKDASPNGQAVTDAIATLESEAVFDGPELAVHLRVAGDEGAIYIDLGDEHWRAIVITATGWTVRPHPVRFRRTRGMAALPEPTRGGTIDQLRRFVNVATDDDWRQVVGWLVGAARPPEQPYPVGSLNGEQGSAKSTTARVLRELLDPSTVPLRAAPHDLRDLMISANNSWVVCFDNLSRLQPWLSDGLCRLATGGGLGTRELYTDDEETLFEARRPILINGIEELATRSDLLDRSILLQLPTIDRAARRPEHEFWTMFYEQRPAILGAVCDALVAALANVSATQLENLPRMADYARWVTAAEPVLGWTPGSFMQSYEGNIAQVHDLAVDACIVGPFLVLAADQGFEGTATELLEVIADIAEERTTKQAEWPKNARALSGLVKRLAPNLRALGITVKQGDREPSSSRRRLITLRR